jgi:hypothetical protein
MIEVNLARALATLRLIERMLHSNETWTVTIGGDTQPAIFEFFDDAITVKAMFDFDMPTLAPVIIKADDEVVFVHSEKVLSGPVCFSWTLEMALPLTA